MRTLAFAGLLFGAFCAGFAASSPYVGTYRNEEVTVEINDVGSGRFAGVVMARGQVFQFTAHETGGALVGTITVDEEDSVFRATVKGSALTFSTDDESYTLTRREDQPPSAPKAPGSAAVRGPSAPPDERSHARPLRINRVTIPEETVRKFEAERRVMIPRGDFWYDKVSGGWGLDGGPTLGFTTPGMNLGGPLPADASRGDTGVFINGRELPLQDVLGLQQLSVPVTLGRWWVDSTGTFGVEGNPAPLGNLFQFSRGRGGAYQRSTAGGYIGGDGETSYFFDPSTGASVMTGN
jgi:hypothetical protein